MTGSPLRLPAFAYDAAFRSMPESGFFVLHNRDCIPAGGKA